MKNWTLAALALMLFACKKEESDGIKEEDKEKAATFAALIQKHDYKLTAYYAETPIDYDIEDDVVKQETELWPYVSPWLYDDAYTFKANNDVIVAQNTEKIPTDNAATITKRWTVVADKTGVRFNFIGHEYQYLVYYLVSFDDTKLKVWANWNGNKVFSEFTALN
jgi:hypothetical protein